LMAFTSPFSTPASFFFSFSFLFIIYDCFCIGMVSPRRAPSDVSRKKCRRG
jgi:hypothetical protein